MRVLLVNPNIGKNHTILGFLYDWTKELAKNVEHLEVITLRGNAKELGKNVNIISLDGKPRILKLFLLNYYLFKEIPKNDIVYVQMYPFMAIFASLYAKIFRKKVVMWYAHSAITSEVLLMHKLVDKVITSSHISFRYPSKKRRIIGQGIKMPPKIKRKRNKEFITLSIGRISRIKRYDFVMDAIKRILDRYKGKIKIRYWIVGPVYDHEYYKELKEKIKKLGLENIVEFRGSVEHSRIYKIYASADLFINASLSGLDKVALESMATGTYTLVCDKAYLEYFDEELKEKCHYSYNDLEDLIKKIEYFIKNREKEEKLREKLREHIKRHHSIEAHAKKVVKVLKEEVKYK